MTEEQHSDRFQFCSSPSGCSLRPTLWPSSWSSPANFLFLCHLVLDLQSAPPPDLLDATFNLESCTSLEPDNTAAPPAPSLLPIIVADALVYICHFLPAAPVFLPLPHSPSLFAADPRHLRSFWKLSLSQLCKTRHPSWVPRRHTQTHTHVLLAVVLIILPLLSLSPQNQLSTPQTLPQRDPSF